MAARRVLAIAFVILAFVANLAGCAQYPQLQTNKALGYNRSMDRLAVWSAVGDVPTLGDVLPTLIFKPSWFPTDPFDKLFHAALKRELESAGVVTEVRPFSPSSDTVASLARFEAELAPTMRLLIMPTQYVVRGMLQEVNFDFSLIDIESNQRVWRGQVFIYSGRGRFDEEGADSLTLRILEALRKDRLLGAPHLPNQENTTKKNPV